MLKGVEAGTNDFSHCHLESVSPRNSKIIISKSYKVIYVKGLNEENNGHYKNVDPFYPSILQAQTDNRVKLRIKLVDGTETTIKASVGDRLFEAFKQYDLPLECTIVPLLFQE